MPYPSEHAVRLRDPDEFERIVQIWEDEEAGIRALGGPLKSDPEGPTVEQSLRFDANKWSVDEVKTWLEEHGYEDYTLEPAAESTDAKAANRRLLRLVSTNRRKKLPVLEIKAYDGEPLDLGGYQAPVVIDVFGLDVKQPIPVLYEHDPARVLGHVVKVATRLPLTLQAELSGAGPDVLRFKESINNGFPWRASVGVIPKDVEFVPKGATAKVNNRVVTGPLYIVRSGRLQEVSVVSLPADEETVVELVAALNKELLIMSNTTKQVQPEAIDLVATKHQAALEKLYASFPGLPAAQLADIRAKALEKTLELKEQALKENMDPERLAAKLEAQLAHVELQLVKAAQPTAPAARPGSGAVKLDRVYECALARTAKLKDYERIYGPQLCEEADQLKNLGLQELILTAARQNGYSGRPVIRADNLREVLRYAWPPIQAEFSSVNVGGILSAIANKIVEVGFTGVEMAWREICRVSPAKDLKTHTVYRMGDSGVFEEVGPSGEITHGTLTEESYTVLPRTYARMFTLTREHILNDDLSAFDQIRDRLGRGGALKLNDVFWTVFLNNSAFFTSARGNLKTGASSALSATSLADAEAAFAKLVDATGHPTGLIPKLILVPVELGVTARQLYVSAEIRDTTSNKVYPVANVFQNRFKPVVSAYLSNSKYTGASATAWYLLADPNDAPVMTVLFLNGNEMPTVESAEADFHVLGIQFRGYYDFGCALGEWRAGVKSTGVA